MTYNTPELLLVGAAQNLVLGTDPNKTIELNFDAPDGSGAPVFYADVLPDGASW